MKNHYEKEILIIEKYLEWYSNYFKSHAPKNEFISEIFTQIIDLGKSIRILLKNNFDWPCLILNRTLGEIVILIFVVCSLKQKPKEAYLAIYELHGWFEILKIYKEEINKEPKYLKKISEKIEKLKKIVMEEFAEPGEKLNNKKIKQFVIDKFNTYIYENAKTLSEQKYKNFPTIQKSVNKILKGGRHYKVESNFTHGKYLSTFFKPTKIKIPIVNDTINRMHLAMTIYALNEKVNIPDINSLINSK